MREALLIYLEVSYLDLNGPSNLGGVTDPDLIREFPPFSPKLAMLAPAVIGWISDLAEETGVRQMELESIFLPMAARVHKALRLPVTPQAAWRKINNEIASEGP